MSEPDETFYVHLFLLASFNIMYGLCSLYLKEHLFVSEAIVSTLTGILLGPKCLGLISLDPVRHANWLDHLSRLVLAVQVMAAGIQLPAAYLKRHWASLACLLGPVTMASWIVTAGLVYLFFWDRISWREAMLIGAILSPTDPVLASSIVKGRFAESQVPLQIRTLLSAESGANDGFALPSIALSLLLLTGPTDTIIPSLILDVLLRKIVLGVVLGLVLGFVARKALRRAERHGLIDKESIVAFNFGLALATLGLATILGTSDLLAIFVLGVEFSWDGWFEEKTAETEFQAVIDSLFSLSFFVLLGSAIPWDEFFNIGYLRLILLTVGVLLLRRVPVTCFLSPWISQLKTGKEALFVGWFGPMGVGALFYAWYCSLQGLNPAIANIVLFIVLGSILVHGATVPAFHLGRETFSLLPEDQDEALEVLTVLITESSSACLFSLPPIDEENPNAMLQ